MIDLRYKFGRIGRLARRAGLYEAVRFEATWTLKRPTLSIRLPGYDTRFVVRRNNSDWSVFETVFVQEELGCYRPRRPRLIIDAGANVGFSTAYFATRYPTARVVAVEPSAENLALIHRHCATYPNVTVVEGGVWHEPGRLRVSNPKAESWSHRCEPTRRGEDGTVPAYTIGQLIDQAGFDRCDLLKLDIEGAEHDLFADGNTAWVDRVDAIMVEVHDERTTGRIRAACPSDTFEQTFIGEKVLLVRCPRRRAIGALPARGTDARRRACRRRSRR